MAISTILNSNVTALSNIKNQLIKRVSKTVSTTIEANASTGLSLSALGHTIPSGYTMLTIAVNPASNLAVVRGTAISNDLTSNIVWIRNITNGSMTLDVGSTVTFIKSTVV